MDEPIDVRFRWTVDELLEARRFHWRCKCRPFFRRAIDCFAMIGILAGYGFYCDKAYWFAVLVPLAGIYWLFLRRFDVRWTTRRRFAKRPDRDMEIQWHISGDKLENQTEASRAETTWRMIAKVLLTPNGILLYPNNEMFYWLPKHGFHDDAEFQRLADLAKSKIANFFEVG